MPTRRPDDDYDDRNDDRPRRDDRDDDRPRRRRERDDFDPQPPKKGGAGRILLILLMVAGGSVLLCCGGCGALLWYMSGRQVTMLDATRGKTPAGGTGSVTVNVRIGGDTPGNMVRGDYNFVFKAGSRQSVHSVSLTGKGGGEFRSVFITPELANETGPVEFWVERQDRGGTGSSRASPTYTIP